MFDPLTKEQNVFNRLRDAYHIIIIKIIKTIITIIIIFILKLELIMPYYNQYKSKILLKLVIFFAIISFSPSSLSLTITEAKCTNNLVRPS